MLTTSNHRLYIPLTAQKNAVRFGSLSKAANSRRVPSNAAFVRLASPFMGGLGGEPQGSLVRFPSLPTRPVPLTILEDGVRFSNLNESEQPMQNDTLSHLEARTRRISEDEIERLLMAMGYDYTSPKTVISRVGAAFLFSLETGLRAGELCSLTWQNVHARHIHLPITKNGFRRDVPLSTEARRILDELPKENESVFNLANTQIDALFRKAKARCLIDDLHWHDTRHEALTRLSQKLNVMELAKIAGIRDLRILQNVYYNPSIEDLADKL